MIFKGFSRKFSLENESQYSSIDEYWDYVSSIYGREKIRGLRYNLAKNNMEYVIGLKDNAEINGTLIKEKFNDAVYKEILLPDGEWSKIIGKTKDLSNTYSNIYKYGPPTYVVENFTDEGICSLLICRNYRDLRLAKEEDYSQILSLYGKAIGELGCTWDEGYPSEEIILNDIKESSLYCMENDQGKIISAIAVANDTDLDALTCWSSTFQPGAELMRLVVAKEYQNQGIARIMLSHGMRIAAQKGYKSVRFLVSKENIRAIRSYNAFNFNIVGEASLFDNDWYCYEKAIYR